MNNPRKHHYVPQVYLKNFALRNEKTWMTYVIDKKNDKEYFSDIKNIAMQKDFYTLNLLDDKYCWEYFYAKNVEPLMKSTFDTLIQKCNLIFTNDKDYILDDNIINNLAIIITIQLLRTPKSLSYQYDMGRKMLPTILMNIKGNKNLSCEIIKKIDNYKLSDDQLREIVMEIICNPERICKFADVLLKKSWVLYKIKRNNIVNFITSDNPVCIYNNDIKSSDLYKVGIDRKHTVIYYPINSQILLVLYDSYTLFSIMESYHKKILFLDSSSNKFILNVNKLQYEQCIQHSFYRPPLEENK